MGRVITAIVLLLLVVSFLGFYYVYQQSKERFAEFESYRSKSEELSQDEIQMQYVEDCEQALIDSGRDYVICSLDTGGNMYLTNDKRVFKPGEYLGLQINLQKLNKYFNSYYMCLNSNFPNYQKSVPDEIHHEFKFCSSLYSQEDYHKVTFSAYVADLPGEYILGEIYLFPELGFSSKEEFFNNLGKGMLILNITGEIE